MRVHQPGRWPCVRHHRFSRSFLLTAVGAFGAATFSCASPAVTDAGSDARDVVIAVDADAIMADATDVIGPTDASPDASTLCPAPVSSAPAISLADFESGTIPSSDTDPIGFRGSDVARGTIMMPGAAGSTRAARFSFATDNALFVQSHTRPIYFDGASTYHPDLANAIEFDIRIPAGSSLLASSGGPRFGVWSYNWNPGDPWVGPNATGGNLTDSQMHGYGNMRFDPGAVDQWVHVVMSSSAFQQSRGNYHFYAARAVAGDLTFFGSVRQFEFVVLNGSAAGATLDFDQIRLVTIPPTAQVCPPSAVRDVPATGGDVREPIEIANPTDASRSYRVFVSSEIGVDRQTLEIAMHDTDSVAAIDDLQGGVGADGSIGAVDLFAADSSGAPTGTSIVSSGTEITVAPHASWHGVLVHHITAAMLGAVTNVTTGGRSYSIRRDTLTTSMIVWDPSEPHRNGASVVFTGSNSDSSHPAPPGFPAYRDPPAGWRSTDVPSDQVGGYFVSVLRLQP